MNELREEYKIIILKACRFAVKGGAMSQAYEDFVIDHIDSIVDDLTDEEFGHLVCNGEIPVRDIENDEGYDRLYTWQDRVNKLDTSNLTDSERLYVNEYHKQIEVLRDEYKQREWEF